MCVRTLTGNEVESVPIGLPVMQKELDGIKQSKYQDKISRAKEKCMKLREEMIIKERKLKVGRQQKTNCELLISEINQDILTKGNAIFGIFSSKVSRYYLDIQHTKLYRILYTPQLAHVIMIAAVLCVALALLPRSHRIQVAGQPHSTFTSLIYLVSIVAHFGSQIWMTFVSGLSLYFALPRHAFSEVQRVLFPRYFTINSCLSLITLLIFIKHHPPHSWDSGIAIQVVGMTSAFFLELLIRLYLTPPLLCLIAQKNSLEQAAGVGTEICCHNHGPLKHCPHYLKIHGAFRRVHASIAVGNMLTMACSVLHLHYIASKLCVL